MAKPHIRVNQGWLRGAEVKSVDGGSFFAFKGIPFAEPPLGSLRFKDPQPKQQWTGVRDAEKEGSQCMQRDELSHEIEGDEDCLYLNVATTSLEGPRPVMVWFHGGGFTWGDGGSDIYGPDYLVQMDVVCVSINYRLGVFGFLQLENEAAAGNMGLKDQVAGLKWVKENIAAFGGDPNNVTIFGESAGAAAVHYHLMSPLSKGLFHKAIAQSGVALNPWAFFTKSVELAHRLVAYLGKETTDPNEIVEYLRSVPAVKLAHAQENLLTPEEKMMAMYVFLPSIDSKSAEPFLPRHPYELIAEMKDVPLIIGYNDQEGVVATSAFSKDMYPAFDQYFEVLISSTLIKVPPLEVANAAKEVRKFYFGEKSVSDEIGAFVKCLGDGYMAVGIHEVVDFRARTKAPTYLYRFSHNAPKKLSTYLWNFEFEGAGHIDDVAYLFYPTRLRDCGFVKPGSIEQVISKRFVKMWTDFAKFGNPTPELNDLINVKWNPISPTKKNYLEINSELSSGVNPDEEMWQFWKRIRAIPTSQ